MDGSGACDPCGRSGCWSARRPQRARATRGSQNDATQVSLRHMLLPVSAPASVSWTERPMGRLGPGTAPRVSRAIAALQSHPAPGKSPALASELLLAMELAGGHGPALSALTHNSPQSLSSRPGNAMYSLQSCCWRWSWRSTPGPGQCCSPLRWRRRSAGRERLRRDTAVSRMRCPSSRVFCAEVSAAGTRCWRLRRRRRCVTRMRETGLHHDGGMVGTVVAPWGSVCHSHGQISKLDHHLLTRRI